MPKQTDHKRRRQLRLASLLHQTLTTLLTEKGLLTSEAGSFLVINKVELSDELSRATVYCSCFGSDKKTAVEQLRQQAKTIRSWLAASQAFRFCPRLDFCYDDQQERLEELLAKSS